MRTERAHLEKHLMGSPTSVKTTNKVLQYSQRHGMINHCDRHITLFSDTDISLGQFNLLTNFDMPFG